MDPDLLSKEELLSQMDFLQSQLQECESNLTKSAEIGQRLLQENEDLKIEMENSVKQYTSQLEVSEQKIYELQCKVDCQTRQEQWFHDEINQLKEEVQNQQKNCVEKYEADKQTQVIKLQKQIHDLQIDLEEANSSRRQLEGQVEEMEALLQQRQEINETLSQTFHLEEIGELQQKLMEMSNENSTLKGQVIEVKADLQKQGVEVEGLKQRLHAKDEEIESLQCQCTSYSNLAERSKMEKMELEAQLDAMKMEMQCQNTKGNSLFSEVEDRRITAEKKVITMKTEYDGLQKRYDLSNQQLRKMKAEMVHYLEMGKGRADNNRIVDLEGQLGNEKTENKKLKEQIAKLEKEKEELICRGPVKQGDGKPVNKGEDYSQYLLTLVQTKSDEIAHLKKEMEVQDMLFLDQKSKLFEMQKTLYNTESEKEKFRVLSLQKNLKLEEMMLKYEPESVKGDKMALKTKREKIIVPEKQKEVEIKSIHSKKMQDISRSSMMLTHSMLDDSVFTNSVLEEKKDSIPDRLHKENKHVWKAENDDNPSFAKKQRFEGAVNYRKRAGGKSVTMADDVVVVNQDGEVGSGVLSEKSPTKMVHHGKGDKKGGKRATNIKMAQPSQSEQNAECATQ